MTAPDTTREGLAKVVEDVAVEVVAKALWDNPHARTKRWHWEQATDGMRAPFYKAARPVAHALAAALHDHLTAALAAEREAVLGEVDAALRETAGVEASCRRAVRNLRAGGGS